MEFDDLQPLLRAGAAKCDDASGPSPEYPQGADYPRLLVLVAEKVPGLAPL